MSKTTRKFLLIIVIILIIAAAVWLTNSCLNAGCQIPEGQTTSVTSETGNEPDVEETTDAQTMSSVAEGEQEANQQGEEEQEEMNVVRITEAELQEMMANTAGSLAGSDNIELEYCTAEIQDEAVVVQAKGSLMGMSAETDALTITFDGMNVHAQGPILILSKYDPELTLEADIYCNEGKPALNVTDFSLGGATMLLKMMGIDITNEKMSEMASGFMASDNSGILCQAERICVEDDELVIYLQEG